MRLNSLFALALAVIGLGFGGCASSSQSVMVENLANGTVALAAATKCPPGKTEVDYIGAGCSVQVNCPCSLVCNIPDEQTEGKCNIAAE